MRFVELGVGVRLDGEIKDDSQVTLRVFTAEGPSSIPVWVTKILHTEQPKNKKERKLQSICYVPSI